MIGIYDKNMPSGLNLFYRDSEIRGVKFHYVDNLNYFEDVKNIIVNPPCSIFDETWKKIGKYIKDNPEKEFFFHAPADTKTEVERLIGKHKNINYLTKEVEYNAIFEKLEDLVREELK